MSIRFRARRTRPWWCARLAVACLLGVACADAPGPAERPVDGVSAPVGEAAATTDGEASAEPDLRPFLPDEMRRATRPESFAHDAHRQIDCGVCHEQPRGHDSHEGLACAECHQAGASASLAALTPEQCQSCHHGVDQPLSCEACHESRPAVTSEQQLLLEVWEAPRTRGLDFDHSVHDELDCASCHQALPALTPAEECASCHSEHHTVQVRCASCHLEPPQGAHDVEAHLTCSGSGCHRAPEVEAIATERPVCLACHSEQADHEPGGDCIECHRVRGRPLAWAVVRTSPVPNRPAPWRHP